MGVVKTNTDITRCDWAVGGNELYISYHDEEWGVPVYSDNKLFEFLILEGAQAGLSWATVLAKRANYRRAFSDFDPAIVAKFSPDRIAELLNNPGIIRNRLKVAVAVTNAIAFLQVADEFGSFAKYLWQFVGGRPIQNQFTTMAAVPATSAESDALSRDLKRRGFKFAGSIIMYAYMQAIGMVNDHIVTCFRYEICACQQRRVTP